MVTIFFGKLRKNREKFARLSEISVKITNLPKMALKVMKNVEKGQNPRKKCKRKQEWVKNGGRFAKLHKFTAKT